MSKVKNKYLIKFETENTKLASRQCILNGGIKNPQSKSVCGIGVTGENGRKHFLYKRWSHMISRCYNHSDINYKNYGNKGIIVCNRWLFLENYISDVVLLEGYNEELVKLGKLYLDKDIINREALIYSPETCKWVTPYENTDESTKRQNRCEFKATNLITNEVVISDNQTKFAKDNNLCLSCINRILLNKSKTKEHKNWKFELLEESL